MNGLHDEDNNTTPLTSEECEGLIPSHITLRRELNELEQQNILVADLWAFTRNRDPLNESFASGLHRRMFKDVWRWAGTYRGSNKNIGVDRNQIKLRLYEAFDNAKYWIEHKTFPPDEIAVRLHHTLVFIHPFPNGNGRWSRLMADIIAVRLGRPRFTWGRNALRTAAENRKAYIEALKAADNHNLARLTAFSRS